MKKATRKAKKQSKKTLYDEPKGSRMLNYTAALVSLILLFGLFWMSLTVITRYTDQNTLSAEGVCISVTVEETFGSSICYYYVLTLASGDEFYITAETSYQAGWSYAKLQEELLNKFVSLRYAESDHFNFPTNHLKKIVVDGKEILTYDVSNSSVTSNLIGVIILAMIDLFIVVYLVYYRPLGLHKQ